MRGWSSSSVKGSGKPGRDELTSNKERSLANCVTEAERQGISTITHSETGAIPPETHPSI
jgi:hypothetical protein